MKNDNDVMDMLKILNNYTAEEQANILGLLLMEGAVDCQCLDSGKGFEIRFRGQWGLLSKSPHAAQQTTCNR